MKIVGRARSIAVEFDAGEGQKIMASRAIEVVGARTHNLKHISCRFPHGRLTVITGVSGSGKSSLAFDTLFAEGQRRYVESMSTYVRQFIEQMPRPDVDFVTNLPPAIALEQKNAVKNARSTVGTATEVYDYLRLLFAKIGRIFCPDCGIEIRRATPENAAETLVREAAGERAVILAPVSLVGNGSIESLRDELIRSGFYRIWLDGETVDLEQTEAGQWADRDEIEVVIDRVRIGPEVDSRLSQAMETALQAGKGRAIVEVVGRVGNPPGKERANVEVVGRISNPPGKGRANAEVVGRVANPPNARTNRPRHAPPENRRHKFFSEMVCTGCEKVFRRPEPNLFSFYSPLGSCPACSGFGRTPTLALDKIIPNTDLTLNERPIVCWNTSLGEEMYDFMRRTTRRRDLPLNTPLSEFTRPQWRVLIEGKGEWCGIRGFFDWLEGRKYKIQARVTIARYRDFVPCEQCGGTRLVPEALNVRVDDRTIADLNGRSIADLRRYFDRLGLSPRDEEAAERLLDEIRSRLAYLDNVGLGYLTLNRQTRTLSGGEAQRINLSAALGSGLTETLYVLDEPTVGLHPRDTKRLLSVLHALKENGNTIAVVEHDPTMMRGADRILDLGPGAGEKGGEVIFEGAMDDLVEHPKSLTAKYLAHNGRRSERPLREPIGFVHVRGARAHNLKNIDAAIPVGVLTCVTGVSGSGKSTLIRDTLHAAFQRRYSSAAIEVGEHDALEGFGVFDDVILVDQSPPSKSTRSNPVTYTKAYDEIRKLMASTDAARVRGVTPGHFSFNVFGGRCEKCTGTGQVTIDMHFLADVSVTCDVCDGKRFKPSMLDLRYKGLNVTEVLDLTVEQATDFFHDQRKIVRALEPLRDVGLGYLRLGQITSTLSGGEAQRLKLAGHLVQRGTRKHVMMLFDEPTTGLHPADLEVLLRVFRKLLDRGTTLVIIEHNLDLIAQADWILDLGPEGGDAGGEIVFAGPLDKFLPHPTSHTARFLREHLDQ